MAKKESGQAPRKLTLEERREARTAKFGEQLAPLHGANPDDWALIYSHSFQYILEHWNGKKGASSSDSAGANDNTDADDVTALGYGFSLGNKDALFRVEKEDCVYEAFVLLVLKNPSFETLGQARAWIARTAAHLYANEWSRAYRAEKSIVPSLQREGDTRYTSNLDAAVSGAIEAAGRMLGRNLTGQEEKVLSKHITGEVEKDTETVKKFVERRLYQQALSQRGR